MSATDKDLTPVELAVEASVLREMDSEHRRRRVGAGVAAAAIVTLFAAVVGLARLSPLQDGLLIAVVLTVAAAIIVAVRTPPSAIVALAIAATSIVATATQATLDGWNWTVGIHCVLTEIGAAVLPVAVFLTVALRNRDPVSVASATQLGALGAICGQLAVSLVCAGRNESGHLWLFHTGGIGLSVVLVAGIAAWRRYRQLRA